MSSSPHEISMPELTSAGAVASVKWRLWVTVLTHLVVDFFSFVIVPLLSVLEGRLSLTPAKGAILLGVGAVSSGLIQPVVALLTDKHDTRILGTLGVLVAVVCVCSVGYVTSFEQLLALQALGAAGIGAFHPVAAAAVGQLSEAHRARWLSIFYAAGMVGGVMGNVITPKYVAAFSTTQPAEGLRALAYLAVPGLVFVLLLSWAIHGVAHRASTAHADHAALPETERRARWLGVGVLYAGNVMRFMTDMCLIQLIIRWSEAKVLSGSGASVLDSAARTAASQINGPMQAAKQVGMGAGGLVIGMMISKRHQRAVLLWVPIIGSAFLAMMPHTGEWSSLSSVGGLLAMLMCLGAGVGYMGVIPTTIGMAQRLLPHRTGLASGLMMGGAWSIAALGPLLVQWMVATVGLAHAFHITAALMVVSGSIMLLFPKHLSTI